MRLFSKICYFPEKESACGTPEVKMCKNMKQEVAMCICIDVNRYINKQKHKNVLKNIQNDGGGRVGGGGGILKMFFREHFYVFAY